MLVGAVGGGPAEVAGSARASDGIDAPKPSRQQKGVKRAVMGDDFCGPGGFCNWREGGPRRRVWRKSLAG